MPNLITLARICAVPVLVVAILGGNLDLAFWIFVAAGVSDALDGYLAKRYGHVTTLGSYLDPVADKALLVSAYVTLGHAGYVETWLVVLVVFRDAMIVGGIVFFSVIGRTTEMHPLLISKINTVFQILLIAVTLAHFGLGVSDYGGREALHYLIAATTILSGLAYIGIAMGLRLPAPLDKLIGLPDPRAGSSADGPR